MITLATPGPRCMVNSLKAFPAEVIRVMRKTLLVLDAHMHLVGVWMHQTYIEKRIKHTQDSALHCMSATLTFSVIGL